MTIINYMIAFIFIAIAETILVAWNIALFVASVAYLMCINVFEIITLIVASLNT